MAKRGARQYVRDFFSNWRHYDGSLGAKLALTVKNRMFAAGHFLTGKGWCCGNHGEPGC
jgi:hypothetical protein